MVTLAMGCGGATPAAESVSPLACERARVAAEAAWREVAVAASEAARPADGDAAPAADRALVQLEAHRDALRRSPREIQGDEALALSNARMDGIDEVSSVIPDRTRERADDAAEALLTDRGRDGSLRAAEGAVAMMEQVLREARPGSQEGRADRRALGELAQRATRAADSYETSADRGDRHADRARVAPIPTSAPPALTARRDGAVERSTDARRACGVTRTISVPSL